jgi:hypothetical protein
MSCNCKGRNKAQEKYYTPEPIDKLVGLELINKSVIKEQQLSNNERQTLYTFYNEQFNERVMVTCKNCWDGFIKEKLRELWKRESLERAQS